MKSYAKIKAGIFSLTLLSMAALGITPSLGLIMSDFPEAGASAVQMLMSLPSLMAVASAAVVGRIANRTSKKMLSLVGTVLVAAGGLLPYFIPAGLDFMLVCAAVLGFGVGLITNLTQLLFTEFLPPEERQRAMAVNTAFVSIRAMFMTTVGGQLAQSGWRNNYLVYLSAVAVFICAMVLIPNDGPEAHADNGSGCRPAKKQMAKASYVVLVLGVLYLIAYNAFPNNIAMYLADAGFGDPALAGLASSVSLLGGLVGGLVLGKILPYFRKLSFAVAFALIGLSYVVLSLVQSLPCIFIFSFISGTALSVFFSQAPFVLSVINPGSMIAKAIALYSVGTSLGGFLSPVVLNAVSGGNAQMSILAAGILSLAVCAVLVLTRFQERTLEQDAGTASATMNSGND